MKTKGGVGISSKSKYQGLFSHELKVVDQAKQFIELNDGYPLLTNYEMLLKNYEKLLKTTKKVFLISDIQGRALKEKELEIEYLLYHDPLTSLYNRTYIDQVCQKVIEAAHLPVSFLFLDVNNLKLMNDVFGHRKGDELLKNVAKILMESLRKSDIAARWGGDEFLVILPNTNEEHCKKIVERIKEKCKIEKKDLIEVSVAVGSATLYSSDENFFDSFSIAEKQMYKNKMIESKIVRQTIIDDLETFVTASECVHSKRMDRLRLLAERFYEILHHHDYSFELYELNLLTTLYNIGNLNLSKDYSEDTYATSEVGYRFARALGELPVAEAVIGCFENWDGSGRPNGLKGEKIPLLSRVLSVLIIFELLLSDSHKSVEEALQVIKQRSGQQLDPQLSQLFIDNIDKILINP